MIIYMVHESPCFFVFLLYPIPYVIQIFHWLAIVDNDKHNTNKKNMVNIRIT